MIDREEITFATCNQLAQLISSDWDQNQPEEVKAALEALSPLDEPGEIFYGVPINGVNPLRLTPSEKEPESIRNSRKLIELKIVINIFKLIMKHSDAWETPDSDTIKKEVIARISNYEDDVKKLTTPVPFTSHITL